MQTSATLQKHVAVAREQTPAEELANAITHGVGLVLSLACLSAGVVWLNTFNRFDATAPFGGYRESGFGREGGRQGLMSYVKLANAKKKTGGKR
jgi:acyl-CoA reductase-like NAD-dependent aldehyde dehydrogenase